MCDIYLFHIEIEGKGGWIIGGPRGMLPPPSPLSNYLGMKVSELRVAVRNEILG